MSKYRSYFILISLFLSCVSSNITATQHNKTQTQNNWNLVRFQGLKGGVKYKVNVGTGFFINENTIVTNKHVVENCINIAVRGAIPPTLTKLYLIDDKLDLALLKSDISSKNYVFLRYNHEKIAPGDILFSIGYPLEMGKIGEYVIKEGKVISVNYNSGYQEIMFTDSVDHGNSGGPLLDKNSNLIGVVTAKITYIRKSDKKTDKKTVAMAIGVDTLAKFLHKSNISFFSHSTYDIFTNYKLDNLANNYTVNIHCIQNTQQEVKSNDDNSINKIK